MQSTRMYIYTEYTNVHVYSMGGEECTQSTGMRKIVHREQAYDDL